MKRREDSGGPNARSRRAQPCSQISPAAASNPQPAPVPNGCLLRPLATLGHFLAPLAALVLAACSGETPPNPVKQAFADAPRAAGHGTAVAFRFAGDEPDARLYLISDLSQVTWRVEAGEEPLAEVLGIAPDDDLIYGRTSSNRLLSLDLVTGRARTVDSNVAWATVGPDGSTYVVHLDGSVGQVEHRSTVTWPDTVTGTVTGIWGAARGRLLVLVNADSGRQLLTLAPSQAPIRHDVPPGEFAISRWGRLAVAVTENGLIMFDPFDSTEVEVELARRPRMITISPSAHRVYAVLGDELVAVDRFSRRVQNRLRLPSGAAGLRAGPMGKRLLVRTEISDSVSVIDLRTFEVQGTVASSWNEDLPAVGTDGTILTQLGGDVVAIAAEALTEVARTQARPEDHWLLAAWNPRRTTLEFAQDNQPAVEQAGQVLYVQVSSSRNPVWAEHFSDELRAAGMHASVLAPDSTDDLYRVVLGPYKTRQAAEADGRQLGRPFWILTKESTPPVP